MVLYSSPLLGSSTGMGTTRNSIIMNILSVYDTREMRSIVGQACMLSLPKVIMVGHTYDINIIILYVCI